MEEAMTQRRQQCRGDANAASVTTEWSRHKKGKDDDIEEMMTYWRRRGIKEKNTITQHRRDDDMEEKMTHWRKRGREDNYGAKGTTTGQRG